VIVVIGTYLKPYERTDQVFLAHRDFMAAQMEAGALLCSGPRDGGGSVIIAYGDDTDAVRALLADDPFAREGYVNFDFHPFRVGLADPRSSLASLTR
jgi:uncharacterized protein